MVQNIMGDNRKTGKSDAKENEPPLTKENEEEMGQTMMDINPAQFLNKDKKGEESGSSGGEESVDDLLRKKKSLKERLGLGKLFGKKDKG